MVENVGVHIEVVEALWAEHHAHVVPPIEQRKRLDVE